MGAAGADAELREILGAIREVEASFEKREARALGVVDMVWGVAVASIFLFYALVDLNPAAYEALFGPFLAWVWTVPVAIGYVATCFVGIRLERAAKRPEVARGLRILAVSGLVPLAILVGIVVTGRGEDYVSGMWVTYLGAVILVMPRMSSGVRRRLTLALGVVSLVVGLALLATTPWWSGLAAAGVYGLGLVGLGTLHFLAHE